MFSNISSAHRRWRWTLLLGALLSLAPRAQSQDAASSVVTPGARGTFGGLLLGAEAVLLVEAALGVRRPWLYAVGGGAGALGGALLGLQSDEAGNAELSMALLVGGVVLAIPTTIAVLSGASYRVPPRKAGGQSLATSSGHEGRGHTFTTHVRQLPTRYFANYHDGSLALGVPTVKLSSVYSLEEQLALGVPRTSRILVPLFELNF